MARLRLPDGETVVLRPLRPGDREGFLAAFERLSDRSRYLRFHKLDPRLRARDVAWLTEVDQIDHVALVVLAPRAGGVALGRFVRETVDPTRADLALTVLDAWHRRGIGSLMLAGLMRRAREVGVATLSASVLDENRPAMGLMGALAFRRTREGSAWVFDLPSDPAALPPGRVTDRIVALDRELERLGAVLGPAG